MNYCEEKGISTSKLNETQRTLYYIAENMRMDKSISEEGYEHFQQAIKALEQKPCEDAISRQAVLEALHTWFRDGFDEDKWWNSTHVLAVIEGLPPVQQEHKWETCFECPLSHGCPKIKGCTNEQAIEYASKIPNDCPLSSQPE